MICVWVDDTIFYCPETDFYQWFEGKMSTKFIISECSDLKLFLGMKFEFSDGIIEISQEKFIDNLLIKFGMSDCKSVSTPLTEKQKFTKFAQTDKPDIDNTTYRSLVGSLDYLARIYVLTYSEKQMIQIHQVLSQYLKIDPILISLCDLWVILDFIEFCPS